MRAVLLREFGDPKNLKVEDVPTPEPRADEVLVAVHAASINPSDVKNVQGSMHGTTLPRIPGRDFAGIVVRGPADLTGREVWGTGGDTGFTRDGSHAEFILLPRAGIALKPAALSMDAAGAAGVTFVTAWSAIVTAAQTQPGDTALIIGAAGGVGSAAVQIAKARGARVLAVVRSDEDVAYAQRSGAAAAIDGKTEKMLERVRALTDGRGAQVVFDTSGMMFADCIEAAGTDARIPIITAPKDGNAAFNLRSLYRKTLRIIGVDSRRLDAVACAELLTEMAPFFQSGQFTVQAAEYLPLEQAAEAYTRAARGGRRIALHPRAPHLQAPQ